MKKYFGISEVLEGNVEMYQGWTEEEPKQTLIRELEIISNGPKNINILIPVLNNIFSKIRNTSAKMKKKSDDEYSSI